MRKFIAFSGGVESSAMCVLFGKNAHAVFADTGWEHQAVYDRIDKVQETIRKLHNNDFTIYKVKAEVRQNGKIFDNLPAYIKESFLYPSPKYRYCTDKFKIRPMDKFLKQFGNVILMIGLNYNEQHRSIRNSSDHITYSYPLINNKITRESCIKILKKSGLYPNFPVYMQRGGCVGCFYKSKKEFYAMALLSPDEFKQVEDIEEYLNKHGTKKKYYSVRDGIKSMKELRKLAGSGMFKIEEMYGDYDQPETPCGVFCNR